VIDTNVLVRLLVIDDPRQCAVARSLFERETVRVLRTVLLESEWVLRARLQVERERIHAFFVGLADTVNVEIEDEPIVREALALYEAGLDFADAMHASAAGADPIATFDERFAKRARKFKRSVRLLGSRTS
jgi:predicted nucleic-acid-binding protein